MSDTPKPFFFFVGKPASGKETQARLLVEETGFPIFMSGAKFRELAGSGTYLGDRVKQTYETGALMPAWIADYLFQEFVLGLGPETGAIFEGSARDLEQVETIDEVCTWLKRPYYAFNLQISDDTAISRSMGRARDAVDTDEEKLRNRLSDYAHLTEPAIAELRRMGKLFDINGEGTLEDIRVEILKHATAKMN